MERSEQKEPRHARARSLPTLISRPQAPWGGRGRAEEEEEAGARRVPRVAITCQGHAHDPGAHLSCATRGTEMRTRVMRT